MTSSLRQRFGGFLTGNERIAGSECILDFRSVNANSAEIRSGIALQKRNALARATFPRSQFGVCESRDRTRDPRPRAAGDWDRRADRADRQAAEARPQSRRRVSLPQGEDTELPWQRRARLLLLLRLPRVWRCHQV